MDDSELLKKRVLELEEENKQFREKFGKVMTVIQIFKQKELELQEAKERIRKAEETQNTGELVTAPSVNKRLFEKEKSTLSIPSIARSLIPRRQKEGSDSTEKKSPATEERSSSLISTYSQQYASNQVSALKNGKLKTLKIIEDGYADLEKKYKDPENNQSEQKSIDFIQYITKNINAYTYDIIIQRWLCSRLVQVITTSIITLDQIIDYGALSSICLAMRKYPKDDEVISHCSTILKYLFSIHINKRNQFQIVLEALEKVYRLRLPWLGIYNEDLFNNILELIDYFAQPIEGKANENIQWKEKVLQLKNKSLISQGIWVSAEGIFPTDLWEGLPKQPIDNSVTVHIKHMRGTQLAPKDSNGLSDPFIRIFGYPAQKKIWKTDVISKTLNPEWDFTDNPKSFIIEKNMAMIKICIYDQDMLGIDWMGSVDIDVSTLVSLYAFSKSPWINATFVKLNHYDMTEKYHKVVSGCLEMTMKVIIN